MTWPTRTEILTAAKAALVAGGVAGADAIFITRSMPVTVPEMPAITLTIDREQDELLVDGQSGLCTPEWSRRSELQVGCFVSASDDPAVDAALTTLVEAVRGVLVGTTTALDGVYQIDSMSAEYYVTNGTSAEFVGACKLVLSLRHDLQYGA
jgi:hypothetical protein